MSARKEIDTGTPVQESLKCYHCGDVCRDETINAHNKIFCCEGCKLVFEILDENNLCNYYNLNSSPGTKENSLKHSGKYDFLDDEKVRQKLISFTDGNISNSTFFIQQIHCSSCIWLLEHLYKLDSGIKKSTVNFLRREVNLSFNEQETGLKKIVTLLHKLGYPPHISLDSIESGRMKIPDRQVYYKLGVAFFCFGNIMLLSFPEYFGLSHIFESGFRNLFGYLNIMLSLPVLLYADTGFFKNAFTGLRQGRLNMDFPISLGIIVMYGRSLFEIISGTGAGYMDTFAGLIFFMLAGRLFQDKTYERLSFERDYKSYFPVAVTILDNGRETSRAVNEVKPGDRILIRNEELIPADCILIKGDASIDYSFVTGESTPIVKRSGDKIFAGGKQSGTSIELEVIHEVSQSRLTQLWNESNYKHENGRNINSVVDKVSTVFTIVVVMIALTSGAWYLWQNQLPKGLNAFTAVLIITCPCALALSYPFALGNSIRILGKSKFFLKNTFVIEKMSRITDIVFDKTGTITKNGEATVLYSGRDITNQHRSAICSLVSHSSHPLSRLIQTNLNGVAKYEVFDFTEFPGKGISGIVNNEKYTLGSSRFVHESSNDYHVNSKQTSVHWSVNNVYMGQFTFGNVYRECLADVTKNLEPRYSLHLVSGDNDTEKMNLKHFFSIRNNLHFNQSPNDKLTYIKELQSRKKNTLMLGDGLNDAGALRQSDCGIALSDNVNNFSPACDGILDSSAFGKLPAFLQFSKSSMKIIYVSYVISFLYNAVGIWFAVQGNLSPLVAAVIMPVSTVSIILFTTVSTNISAVMNRVSS